MGKDDQASIIPTGMNENAVLLLNFFSSFSCWDFLKKAEWIQVTKVLQSPSKSFKVFFASLNKFYPPGILLCLWKKVSRFHNAKIYPSNLFPRTHLRHFFLLFHKALNILILVNSSSLGKEVVQWMRKLRLFRKKKSI